MEGFQTSPLCWKGRCSDTMRLGLAEVWPVAPVRNGNRARDSRRQALTTQRAARTRRRQMQRKGQKVNACVQTAGVSKSALEVAGAISVVSCRVVASGGDTGTVLFGHDHERKGAAEGWEMGERASVRAWVGWTSRSRAAGGGGGSLCFLFDGSSSKVVR